MIGSCLFSCTLGVGCPFFTTVKILGIIPTLLRIGLLLSTQVTAFSYSLHAAEPPRPLSPFIESIFPRGGGRGTEFELRISGRYLGQASLVRISGEGVTARLLDGSESAVRARISISPEAKVGRRDLRVVTPNGSFVQLFQVGSLPEQIEAEPNDDWSDAEHVKIPVTINGTVPRGDYDHFRLEVQAGQTITFDLNSSRTGTRFDGLLSLLDWSGQEIAFQDDYYFDKDPHLVHTFAQSGTYVLRVYGFRESGSDSAEYRLVMGELPSLSHVFPAGGRGGTTVAIRLWGNNLHLVEQVVLGHGIHGEVYERSPQHLRARLQIPLQLERGQYPLGVTADGREMPNPLIFDVSHEPELSIWQPGSVPLSRTLPINPPVILNGVIDRESRSDVFELQAQAGEQYAFDSRAMKLGNFLDPSILIYDQQNRLVAYLDDTAPNCFGKEPPNVDFHLVHTFEESGRHKIIFRDAGKRGHPSFVYRLAIRRSEPDFEVTVLTNQLTALPGQRANLLVRIRRMDGWNTPVEVWSEGEFDGIESERVTAPPENTRYRGVFGEDFFLDGTNVELPFQVSENTPLGIRALQIRARGVLNEKVVERRARVVYPWQETGFVRGYAHDDRILLTVARVPLFDLKVPATVQLTPGQFKRLPLTVRWFTDSESVSPLSIEVARQPFGIMVEAVSVQPGIKEVEIRLRAEEGLGQTNFSPLVLQGSVRSGSSTYTRTTADISVEVVKPARKELGLGFHRKATAGR